ncbi:short chain dehydrogenase [Chitinispirillum alkaliphilum]|nr:short chain dehydrogenase [Chitinispirillum alkaliphilum]
MPEQMHHGLNVDFNPFVENELLREGPPEQIQEWPGTDENMHPQADHGEQSYVGGSKLQGKVALITGGDSGIGRAAAIAFAREGADVVISYLNEHKDAEETLYWIEKSGSQGLALSGDIRDSHYCRDLVERTVNKFGTLNILVNNAAFHMESQNFMEISPEQLDQTFRTNIMSFFWTTQESLKHMNAGDCIINVGSVVAMMGHPQLIDYSCTKAAIHNFTQSMSQLLADKGIRVNCIAPGPVWTPLIPATRDEQFVGGFGANTFWKRPAQPAELAPSFVFLASTDSRYYTGEVLAPTGFNFSSI